MESTRWGTSLALVHMMAVGVMAQPPATVQLPTYSYFGVSTTVSVPDRGGAWLGGINRAADGSQSLGAPRSPFSQRALGRSRGAAGAGITATVHDFDAMEDRLLRQSASTTLPAPAAASWPHRLMMAAKSSAGRAAPSVAEMQAARIESKELEGREASDWFARGCRAEAEGNTGAAKVYFGMAARRAEGPARDEILARLDTLRSAPTVGNKEDDEPIGRKQRS